VYAGADAVRKKDLYLEEVVPQGPRQETEAERVRTRLLNQWMRSGIQRPARPSHS
jgi:hypothetical protein